MKLKSVFERYYLLFFWAGIFVLLAPPVARVYLLMPFPGSQDSEYFHWAYFFSRWNFLFLIAGIGMSIFPFIRFWRNGRWFKKTMLVILFIFCVLVLLLTNIFMDGRRMFLEPEKLIFKNSSGNQVSRKSMVMGVTLGGISKAYPLEFIVYHHQLQDTVGGMPVLITYCGMCRSGRVFSPEMEGTRLRFGIVGVHHRNAIFEDEQTKSWWYQETGEALLGPMKGKQMEEIFSEQSTLESWMEKHPESLIMQPDPASEERYASMKRGFNFSAIEMDSAGGEWNPYALVAGVKISENSKAYHWSDLLSMRLINDKIGNDAVLVFLEKDSLSFHAWKRESGGKTLEFMPDSSGIFFIDKQTNSKWNSNGKAVEGELKGLNLDPVPAYQEYWQSWKTFNPATEMWRNEK